MYYNTQNKPHKILILAKHIDGGTGTFVMQLRKLPKYDHSINTQTLVLERPEYRQIAGERDIICYRSRVHYPNYYRLRPNVLFLLISEFFWLVSQVKQIKPDVIISVDTHCNLLALSVKLLLPKTKVIATVHNNISAVTHAKLTPFVQLLVRASGRLLLNKADRVVGISKGLSDNLISYFSLNKKPDTIYYGINQTKVYSLAKKKIVNKKEDKLFSDRKTIKVVSVGRLSPQKDFVTLIQAFAQVYQKQNNARLFIFGDGEDHDMLKSLIKSLKLEHAIYLLGWKQNIFPYLKRSDIFVLSSLYEGFGWVLLEAMTMKLPVITTNSPYGPRELLEKNQSGIVVPLRNRKIMANAILHLIQNKDIRADLASRGHLTSQAFSELLMLKQYLKLIHNVISNMEI